MDRYAAAARLIAEHRTKLRALDELPVDLAPRDSAEGYRIKESLHGALAAAGRGSIAGWKIGCTTRVMQAYLNISNPCAGGILGPTVHSSDVTLPHEAFVRVGVECEIAVRLAVGLPPPAAPFDRGKVAAAVGQVMAGIELVDDRYVDWRRLDAPTLCADDFFGAGCVLGDPVADWRRLDLALMHGRMTVDGVEVGTGRGADVMGHPFEALAWLANQRASQGAGLAAGDIVMTGSIVQTNWIARGQSVVVAIDGLGEARVRFD
jgi:2-oxo-3-hexenedioate decarboxylase/2-keto-4-pentenoate hydratase